VTSSRENKKWLYLASYFYPEIGSMRLAHEMASYMGSHGYSIYVVTTYPRKHYTSHNVYKRYSEKKGLVIERLTKNVIVIRSGKIYEIKNTLAYNLLEVFLLPLYFLIGSLKVPQCNIASTSNHPITNWFIAYFLKLIGKIKAFTVRVDDIYPDNLKMLGILRNNIVALILDLISRLMYKRADCIIVHSRAHKKYLVTRKNVDRRKIVVVPLWADIRRIESILRKSLSSRELYKVVKSLPEGKFKVFFGGLMSYAQGMENVVKAAYVLEKLGYRDILFVLVGKGPEKAKVTLMAKKLGLNNVIFMPMQPYEIYLFLLSSCDLCLVPLNENVKIPVIPSKLLEIMACKKTCLVITPPQNKALYDLVSEAQCGLIVPPDPYKIAEAIVTLYRDKNLLKNLAENGYTYAITKLSLEECAKYYMAIHKVLTKEEL